MTDTREREIVAWFKMDVLHHLSPAWRFGLGKMQCDEIAAALEANDHMKEGG